MLTQGIIYVRLGRLAFAEQILLRSLGIFVIIQELDSAHELFLLQCIHFLAITLELSGDEDKFIYAKSCHEGKEVSVKKVKKQRLTHCGC